MPKRRIKGALRSKADAIYIRNEQNKQGKTKYIVKKVPYGYKVFPKK